MANLFAKNFSKYMDSVTNFEKFHNNVINMPRANFSELAETIKLLKSLASYISIIEPDFFEEPTNYKELYRKY